MELQGKVGLITGGTHGIGRATAVRLARGGADVALVARTLDAAAQETKNLIESFGRHCELISADIGNPQQAAQAVEKCSELLGRADILVHSAGGAAPGGLLDTPEDVWYHAFDVHVHAVFQLCRAIVPLMQKHHEGSIVLISSAAGLRGCRGALAYGVAKGALIQFARALARELADDNIRVNCVSPGVIRTRFQDSLSKEQVENNLRNRIPLHKEGKPEDVAEAIALLATNEYITGENLVIDGGLTMRIV